MAGSSSIPIEKLRGIEDWNNWKFQLKMVLMHEDLHACIETAAGSEDAKKNQKALAKICLSVHSSIFQYVRNAETPFDAWQNLKKAFEDKGLSRRLGLLRTLFATKLSECNTVENYLSKITDVAQQLSDIGFPLDDEFVAVLMLSGLTPDYDPLIMALENSNAKLISEIVKTKLLQESQRRDHRHEDMHGESALVTKKHQNGPLCFKCKKPGHLKRNCPKNNYSDKKPFKRDSSTAKEKALVLALSVGLRGDVWYVDSGATNHMCNNRSVMCDFRTMNSLEVNVANGEKLSSVGCGSVRVHLKDCVKTISNVHYVPNLSVNLLSVSELSRKGYQIVFNSKQCKIIDNDKIVATATYVNGVYQLDTVGFALSCTALESAMEPQGVERGDSGEASGSADSCTATQSVANDGSGSEETRGSTDSCTATQEVWHRRLGHLNSRSMTVMKVPMTQVVAVAGEPVYLPCDISTQDDEDAVLLVLWYREDLGTPIYSVDARERDFGVAERWSDESVFASRAYFLPERRPAELGVDRVRASDQGVYRCRVDFKQAQTRNSRVNLTVIVPPSKMVIIDDKGDVKQAIVGPYIEGDTFTLKCDVSGGRPRPWVKWFRDEIETDTPASPLSGNGVRGILRVGPLTRADVRAALTCRASNHPRAHPIETTLTLDMNFPPLTVHIIGSNQPLSASRRYDLLCQSSGSRPPASITWWKNGHRINNAKETLSTDGNTTTSTVSLQFTKSDAGAKLACRASNPQMPSVPALEDDWTLDIQYVPETTVRLGTNLDPTNIREGSDVYFDCIIRAHPYVYKVEWRHNGKTLLHNVGQGVIISNQSLVLQGVGRRTAGNYTCVGYNAEGDGESKPFSLDVLYAPTCRSSQQRVHGVAKQERAHITCHVDANPPDVLFRWTFNNTANSNEVSDNYVSRAGTSSTVTYTPHTEMDYGTLLCWAHNRIGKQRVPCVYHIIAAGRPDQVHNCTVVNASLTSFGVRCSEGFNGGMPQSFLLEVRDSVTHEIVANVSSAVPRFTAVGLQPGKTYAAAVLAYNAKGRGDPYPLRASTVRPPEKHHVHDKSLDIQRNAFQMSGAMSAAVGGGGVLMVVLVLFMIAVRQKCAKRKPRSAPPPSSQPASPDKLREKDDSESDDRNPDIIPSDTDQMQMDYYRQQQVSTISPPPGNRGPRGSVAGVRGGLPAYCALRTAPPPSHPAMHEATNATSGIPPPARFASGSCTLPRGSTIAAQTDGRCGIPLQHLRTLPRPLPAPAPAPAPRSTPRDTPL